MIDTLMDLHVHDVSLERSVQLLLFEVYLRFGRSILLVDFRVPVSPRLSHAGTVHRINIDMGLAATKVGKNGHLGGVDLMRYIVRGNVIFVEVQSGL